MEWYLPLIWAALIGTAVFMYVLLDGFDLGIGILFRPRASESERDQMTRTIAPYWDGNETWLILGGAGLFVAFPRAYAVIMPALYLPVIVMLLALVFRGVAFEFRHVSYSKTGWNVAFNVGSTLGRVRAGCDSGRPHPGRRGARRRLQRRFVRLGNTVCLPVRAVFGWRLCIARAPRGSYMKTEGPVADRARSQAKVLLLAVLAFMAAVSLWTPLSQPAHRRAMVQPAELLFPLAGAAGDGAHRLSGLALARNRPRGAAISGEHARFSSSAFSDW